MRSRFFKYPTHHLDDRQRYYVRKRFPAAFSLATAIFNYRPNVRVVMDKENGFTAESFVIVVLQEPGVCICTVCRAMEFALKIDNQRIHT